MSSAPTMRAVRYHGPRRSFSLQVTGVPEPGAADVRVAIAACGMCRTELHLRDGLLDLGRKDITVGHEISGTIEAVGQDVPAVRIGQRVVVYYYEGCGSCRHCRVGDEQLCPQPRRQPGFTTDGGYADRIVVRARNCVPLPDQLSFAQAAPLGCAGSTAVHAGRLAVLEPGSWVVVHGTGGVGFALIQYAAFCGARVIALGRGADRMTLCRELGAVHTIDLLDTPDPAAQVDAITAGEGAAAVFELVGTAATMALSAALLGRRGRLVLIGYTAESLTIHPIALIVREARLIGSVGATLQDLYEAVDLAGRGRMRMPVDRVLPLDRFADGLQALEHERLMGRIVLQP